MEIGHESRRRIAASLEMFGQGPIFAVERRRPIYVQLVMPATSEHGRVGRKGPRRGRTCLVKANAPAGQPFECRRRAAVHSRRGSDGLPPRCQA